MNITVLTCITGGYDPPPMELPPGDHRYLLATSQPDVNVAKSPWTHWPIRSQLDGPKLLNRQIKILLPMLAKSDYTLYLDGNIRLLVDPEQLVEEWLWANDKSMALFPHPTRTTIREEVDELVTLGKMTPREREAFTMTFGGIIGERARLRLAGGGVLLRETTDLIKDCACRWFSLVTLFSLRDQITLPIAHREMEEDIHYIDGVVRDHPYFSYRKHPHE